MKINSNSPVLVNQANQQVKVAKKEATRERNGGFICVRTL